MQPIQDILSSTSTEDWVNHIQAFHKAWFDDADSIQVNTSGSTGTPKIIALAKSAMVISANNTINHFNIPTKANALICLPANFIAGKMMLVRAMVGNWNLLATKPTTAIDFGKNQFDFVAMTPHQVIATIKKHGVASFSSIKTLIIGGGEIPKTEFQTIVDLPCQVFSTYGMTETITHIATKAIQQKNEPYRTLPGIVIGIDNRGCLTIEADYLMETIITNDVVNLLENSSFKWLGRYDNVINSGGLKIHPEQLEQKLATHCNQSFFFHGAPHHTLGEQLVLIVTNTHELPALKKQVEVLLPKLQQAKQIWIVESFNYTKTGKINRKATLETVLEKRDF
jgi:O-succinylbenzoic acid--CoA ligase